MILVSVIIVNWNGAEYLPACLSALVQQTYRSLEMIIVDNASSDNSVKVIELFRMQHPKCRLQVIHNSTNEGFCRGNNRGIGYASGEGILLLNADVTLEPDCIATLVELMQSDAEIGIAVGKLVSGYDAHRIDSTGILICKNRRAFDRGQGEEEFGNYVVPEEVFGASGAACLYRRTMLEEVKYPRQAPAFHEYLDELFFAYKEDVDLSWRARLYGWKCVYTPGAVGQHFRRWGTGQRKMIPKDVRRHSLKNRYLMLLKNECWATLLPGLLHILWFEVLSVLYILFREPYLFSVFGTIIAVWPEIMKKRRITQQSADRKQIAKNLLPWFQ